MAINFKRVIIKLSGEALRGAPAGSAQIEPLGFDKIKEYAKALAHLNSQGLQMGIVVGGGNIYRGRREDMSNRTDGDHMGMLATAINSLALSDALKGCGAKCSVMSAIPMEQICDTYSQREADKRMAAGEIVIFACGFGRPYFSTDTASAIRAVELNAEMLLCGKNIDGIYDRDPNGGRGGSHAVFLPRVSYRRALIDKNIEALDNTAIVLSEKHGLKLLFFKLDEPQHIIDAICGKLERFSYIGPDVSPDDISDIEFPNCYAGQR